MILRRTTVRFGVALLVAAFTAAAGAKETTYTISPGGGNEVVFTSRAVGETFDGRTDRIHGSFTCDPGDLRKPARGEVWIEVESLDTGIGLRNNHMFKNHLEPEKYPRMTFALEGLVDPPPSLPVGEAKTLTARGKFTCHGVTNPLEPELTVVRDSDGSLVVEAEWTVKLTDYEIPRPQFLFVKLAEEQEIDVRFTATPE